MSAALSPAPRHGSDPVELAHAALARDGVAVIDDLIDPAVIARCRAELARDYPDLESESERGKYRLAPRRFIAPLRVEGALADRAVFANPVVLDIAGRLLGEAFELDSFSLLLSLPGASQQALHYDAFLYPEAGIDRVLPVTALAVAIPLVPLDEIRGTTGFCLGSHRFPDRREIDFARVAAGSVLMWDYRVFHAGLANTGDSARPVLHAAFARRWWHEEVPADAVRYEKLALPRARWSALDPQLKRVTARAKLYD